MLKEKFEVRKHVVKEKLLVEQRMFCDVCGKEIEHQQYYWTGSIDNYNYGERNTNNFDVCSEKCLKEMIDDYCEMSKNSTGYEISVERRIFRRKI